MPQVKHITQLLRSIWYANRSLQIRTIQQLEGTTQSGRLGKLSPSWEGSYLASRCMGDTGSWGDDMREEYHLLRLQKSPSVIHFSSAKWCMLAWHEDWACGATGLTCILVLHLPGIVALGELLTPLSFVNKASPVLGEMI